MGLRRDLRYVNAVGPNHLHQGIMHLLPVTVVFQPFFLFGELEEVEKRSAQGECDCWMEYGKI